MICVQRCVPRAHVLAPGHRFLLLSMTPYWSPVVDPLCAQVDLPYDDAVSLSDRRDWAALLQHDQLSTEMQRGRVFFGFTSAPIDFPPSYRHAPTVFVNFVCVIMVFIWAATAPYQCMCMHSKAGCRGVTRSEAAVRLTWPLLWQRQPNRFRARCCYKSASTVHTHLLVFLKFIRPSLLLQMGA